jgi:hypothetical protein
MDRSRLPVEADPVSRRVAEPRSDLGCIDADGLYDFTAERADQVEGLGFVTPDSRFAP